MYRHDSSPEIFSALSRNMKLKDQKFIIFPVLRLESGKTPGEDDSFLLPDPILAESAELRGTMRRLATNSVQFTSPLGVLFGKKKVVSELCVLADDGEVVSLRRNITTREDGLEWREKAYGKLIEAGRKYLIALFSDSSREIAFPEEVLSACSFQNRKAESIWSSNGREEALTFLSEMPEIPESGKQPQKNPKETPPSAE